MTFAEKLKSLRKQSGMSQEKLAERLGVSRQAITKWETEAGIPEVENLMGISSLFDISIDELLSALRNRHSVLPGIQSASAYFLCSATGCRTDKYR